MQVNQVSYHIGDRTLFSNISFNTDDDPLIVIEGKNGSGKSTLLKVILGLLKPATGQVDNNQRIGYVPDSSANYFVGMSARILFHFLQEQFGLDKVQVAETLQEMQAGLAFSPALLNTKISALSLGEKKKVMLIAAWLLAPQLFVMDEPFSGLDTASLTYLIGKIEAERQAGRQFIIVTHDYRELFPTVNRVIGL